MTAPAPEGRGAEPTFRPLDRVRVHDQHPDVPGWEGLIAAECAPPEWPTDSVRPLDGWYWFVPLEREHSPKVWPIIPPTVYFRFHASELVLVAPWRPYPPDAPYDPAHQVWLQWMGEAIAVPAPERASAPREAEICGHQNVDNGYVCTLNAGHGGDHAANYPAANPITCLAVWDDSGRYVPAERASAPPGETPKCEDCGVELSADEAKLYDVCEDCWTADDAPPTPNRDETHAAD